MEGHVTRTLHSDSQPWLWKTSGRSVSEKSNKMTRHSEWTPYREKFSEKSFRASSSQNRMWEGVGSKEDDALERKGFWDRADLHLGVIDKTNINKKKGRERKTIRKAPKQFKYNKYIEKEVHMHGECMNMWYAKEIASWAQPNPILPAHNQMHTSKMHDNTVIMLMWCNAWDFKTKSLKPIPKLQKKLNNFEKPQILGFKTWKCMKKRDLKLTKWRKTGKSLKKPWGRSLEWVREVLGEEKTEVSRERSTEKSCGSHEENI